MPALTAAEKMQLEKDLLNNLGQSYLDRAATEKHKELERTIRGDNYGALCDYIAASSSPSIFPDGPVAAVIREHIQTCIKNNLIENTKQGSDIIEKLFNVAMKETSKLHTHGLEETKGRMLKAVEEQSRILLPKREIKQSLDNKTAEHSSKLITLLQDCGDFFKYKASDDFKKLMQQTFQEELTKIFRNDKLTESQKSEQIITKLKDIYQVTYEDSLTRLTAGKKAAIISFVTRSDKEDAGRKQTEKSDFLKNIENILRKNGVGDKEINELKKPLARSSVSSVSGMKNAVLDIDPAMRIKLENEKKDNERKLASKIETQKQEIKDLESKGNEPQLSGPIANKFRTGLSEFNYAWEIQPHLKDMASQVEGKITFSQLYNLTNYIAEAIQDSTKVQPVAEELKKFNEEYKQLSNNSEAQKNCIDSLISRIQPHINKAINTEIITNITAFEDEKFMLKEKAGEYATKELGSLDFIEELVAGATKTRKAAGQLTGAYRAPLNQILHDPSVTCGPNAREKTRKAIGEYDARFKEAVSFVKDIGPLLNTFKEECKSSPNDIAVISKIQSDMSKFLLSPQAKYEDAFKKVKIYEAVRNTIEEQKVKASSNLRGKLERIEKKYDAQLGLSAPSAKIHRPSEEKNATASDSFSPPRLGHTSS